MNYIIGFILAFFITVMGAGCTRIETGEVGVRINASKQIEGNELPAGGYIKQSLVLS
jgi:hypothetical protein